MPHRLLSAVRAARDTSARVVGTLVPVLEHLQPLQLLLAPSPTVGRRGFFPAAPRLTGGRVVGGDEDVPADEIPIDEQHDEETSESGAEEIPLNEIGQKIHEAQAILSGLAEVNFDKVLGLRGVEQKLQSLASMIAQRQTEAAKIVRQLVSALQQIDQLKLITAQVNDAVELLTSLEEGVREVVEGPVESAEGYPGAVHVIDHDATHALSPATVMGRVDRLLNGTTINGRSVWRGKKTTTKKEAAKARKKTASRRR